MSHRDLKAWTAARNVARDAYSITMRKGFDRHQRLAEQIRSACSSIPANISEGYGLGTLAQFIRHLRIALASAYELQDHIELARDMTLAPGVDAQQVLRKTHLTIALIIGLLKRLGAKPD